MSRPKLSLSVEETGANAPEIDLSSNQETGQLIQIGGGDGIDLDASYEVSASGTLRTQGFVIKQSGITAQPNDRRISNSIPSSTTNLDGELSFNPSDLCELGSVGKGACGVVKRALHVPTLKVVALKQINIFDKDKRHQFVKELTALGAVNSPYIVGFMGATYAEGSITILLEYANRHSLLEMLKTYGAFEELILQRIALHTFKGLEILHRAHCIHRDIKPGNILINSGAECKLTDFGIVTALEGTMDLASTFVGTTIFMAPERVTQEGKYSYASDVWSAGVTLWYLAVGELPYPSTGGYWGIVKAIRDDPVPQLPAVHPVTKQPYSDAFRDFLAQCLQKDPIKRVNAHDILQHPFLKDADQKWTTALKESKTGILHPLMAVTQTDLEDLDAVLVTLYRSQYANGRAEYRKSLMELARFQKLAENFNNRHISPEKIQTRFEELYQKLRQSEKKK